MGRSRSKVVFAVAFAVVATAATAWLAARPLAFDPTDPRVTLTDVETKVSQIYPVPEMTAATLAARVGAPDVLVFDVREPDEFAKSHITGARQISPDMSAADFEAAYGGELRDRTVVFYCAVGVRSGRMLSRVSTVLGRHGASGGYNLRGGIFRWHEARQSIIPGAAANGVATVHPYDEAWGQLLRRTIDASERPQGAR